MKNYFTILLVAFSSLSIADTTTTIGTHTYHYDLMLEALNVGNMTIKIVSQADGSYVIAESTWVETEGWWGDINEASTKIENYSPEYKILVSNPETIFGLGWKLKIDIFQLADLMLRSNLNHHG